jgi:hypothetical protein
MDKVVADGFLTGNDKEIVVTLPDAVYVSKTSRLASKESFLDFAEMPIFFRYL